MKRTAPFIMPVAMFLLVGLAVNVAVAWYCSQLVPLRVLRTPRVEQPAPARWPRPVPTQWPPSPEQSTHRNAGSGYREIETSASQMWREPPDRWVGIWVYEHFQIQTGWPLKSMERESRRDYLLPLIGWPSIDGPAPLPSWRGGLHLSWRDFGGGASRERRLPLRPLVPGFALNTLLYITLAASVWYTPGIIRRARRRHRNACQSCGYSRAGLATHAPCPECGAGRCSASAPSAPSL